MRAYKKENGSPFAMGTVMQFFGTQLVQHRSVTNIVLTFKSNREHHQHQHHHCHITTTPPSLPFEHSPANSQSHTWLRDLPGNTCTPHGGIARGAQIGKLCLPVGYAHLKSVENGIEIAEFGRTNIYSGIHKQLRKAIIDAGQFIIRGVIYCSYTTKID